MEKRSRKWWALTKEQRRHDKSVKHQAWRNADRDFRMTYCVRPWKTECSLIMKNASANGGLTCLADAESNQRLYEHAFPKFMKDANWYYF
jgi:hypothetical protein